MKCMSRFALLIAIILSFISIMIFLMMPVDIQAAINTTEILVNISEVSQITVSPDHISWLQVAPGGNGTLTKITVRNTGSTSFSTGIYVSVDTFGNTTNNPTYGDDTTKYMSGSFLVMGNSTDKGNDIWWFVNTIAWNESSYPEPTSPTSGAHSWGYFYNKTDKWLWEVKGNSTPSCNVGPDDGGSVKIVQTQGSKNLGSVYSGDFLGNDSTWSVWSFSDGIWKDYCVAVHINCNYTMIYRFDQNSSLPAYNVCNNTYLYYETLNPNNEKYFWAKPHVPWGVPAGTASNSTVTFTVS